MPAQSIPAPLPTPLGLSGDILTLPVETIALAGLRPHPRNYRRHPAEQLAHLKASIQAHGFYRNIVVAEDGTILAGHGVVLAARELGYTHVPVVRVPLAPDDDRAIQILVGDNELPRLSANDEQVLAGLLAELHANDPVLLLGTGFDEGALVALRHTSDFQPVGVDAQGKLDQKAPITCPHCGEEFVL